MLNRVASLAFSENVKALFKFYYKVKKIKLVGVLQKISKQIEGFVSLKNKEHFNLVKSLLKTIYKT